MEGVGNTTENFIFDTSTGEIFAYSKFYKKLISLDGESIDAYNERITRKSTIINNILKIDVTWKNTEHRHPSYLEWRINLDDMTIKSKSKPGYGSVLNSTSTGSCKYTEPKTTEIHQDK